MIVYFTGTGNSKYVAQMVADLTRDEAISANDYIKKNKKADFESEKPYVFVAPVYVSAIPRIFEKFIREANLNGTKDAYFIMTCAGGMGACPVYAEKICKSIGLSYKGTAQIVMPQNYIAMFKTKTKDECNTIVDAAGTEIANLAEQIGKRRDFPDPGVKKWEYVSTEMVIDMYYKWFMPTKKFTVSEKCIGCGKCENSCPLNNIVLENKKPKWGNNCTHCMACINMCPTEAIEYGKGTEGKPRYRCKAYK